MDLKRRNGSRKNWSPEHTRIAQAAIRARARLRDLGNVDGVPTWLSAELLAMASQLTVALKARRDSRGEIR